MGTFLPQPVEALMRRLQPATGNLAGRRFLGGRCGGGSQTDGFGVFQIRLDRSDYNAGFHREQLNTDERYLNPGVNHDAFVKNTVDNFRQAR